MFTLDSSGYFTPDDNWNKFLNYFFQIDFTKKRYSGIYLIDNFYIGKTQNLRIRLKCHIQTCFNGHHFNNALRQHINDCIKISQPMPVKIIDTNTSNERYHIKKYLSEGYNLLNLDVR